MNNNFSQTQENIPSRLSSGVGGVDQQFTAITEKLQLLLRQQLRLKKENERLMQELETFRQKENTYQQQIHELEQRISVLKFATGDMLEKEKKEFEKKLNQYIREIDRCIQYLSQ